MNSFFPIFKQPNFRWWNGTRIKTRNGRVWVVIDSVPIDVCDNAHLNNLHDDDAWYDDFSNKHTNAYDIMEICASPNSAAQYFDNDILTAVLWTRNDDEQNTIRHRVDKLRQCLACVLQELDEISKNVA